VHLRHSTTEDAPEIPCAESIKAKKCLSYEPAEKDELPKTPVGCYTESEQIHDGYECNGDTPYGNHAQVDGAESALPEEYRSKNHAALRNEPLMADIGNIVDEVRICLHLNSL
jgi:hypothetical protein